MAENNRIENRLLDSIRKAKTGLDSGADATSKAATNRSAEESRPVARKAAVHRATGEPTAGAIPPRATRETKTHADPSRSGDVTAGDANKSPKRGRPRRATQAPNGNYQCGMRVWPD